MSDDVTGGPGPEKPVHRKTPPATPAVQAWLDGDVPRDGLATADEQETAELWSRINKEAEELRKRHTPIHVQSRILSSLPATPTVRDEAIEEAAKPNTSVIVIAGIALLAVGAALGFLLVR
jgi:hypothetical protein